MTNKELGIAARTTIKEEGFNLKDFSVRTGWAGYESVLIITVKNEKITSKEINELRSALKKFEIIDRCEVTGEILSGGNTFIRITDVNGYGY